MELRTASLRDVLTGLGNRTLFREQASKLVQHAKRERNNVAVLFLDVDGLKPVNDSFGHLVGDQVLKQIARRLQERTRESDIVARVGGDEFLVLLGRIDSPESALKVGDDLSRAISQKIFAVDGHDISVGLSCGTALFPQDSENIDDLIRLADQRMYDVKALTKSRRPGGQLVWGR
jgi:diguanylate cyclase (GGDEF)-like protein